MEIQMSDENKVFFWLLLKDRVNLRDLLRRKNMTLESYTCDMCNLQRPETAAYLFVGKRLVSWWSPRIKQHLGVPFFVEIIILLTWSI
jgi:hypothetical protein